MASLPSRDAVLAVATGKDGVIEGSKVKRFVDLSTTGARMANESRRRWGRGTSYRSTAR